jgi:hypothetical protein
MNIFCTESPEFYLAYNPLECDCRTDWLVKMEDLALSGPYPLIVDMDRYTQYRLAGQDRGFGAQRTLSVHREYGQVYIHLVQTGWSRWRTGRSADPTLLSWT